MHFGKEELEELHETWGKRFSGVEVPVFRNSLSHERRVHVGLVSADFRWHSVAFFLLGLLKHRDKSRLEITCFSDNPEDDDMTGILRNLADSWVTCKGLSDSALLKIIRRSRVDVLVDLAGHTAYNRMAVFGRRAAPVQVSWLGYPTPTGNPHIDFWFTDAGIHSEDVVAGGGCSEPVCLASGAHAYHPPVEAAEMPVDRVLWEPESEDVMDSGADTVWLGCFNHRAKLSSQTLEMWAAILRSAPHTKLLLKTRSFADERVSADLRKRFGLLGVDPCRLSFRSRTDTTLEHLQCYRCIDLALDSFPYNGTTTTCESLWMGVPVVTRSGNTYASRVTGSLLNQLGKPEWVADSAEGYVQTALNLIADVEGRRQFRKNARGLLQEAGLTDSARFAECWTTAVEDLWRRYVAQG